MTITPNWLESPAKVELTQGDILILHTLVTMEVRRKIDDEKYTDQLMSISDVLHAAFRGPKS